MDDIYLTFFLVSNSATSSTDSLELFRPILLYFHTWHIACTFKITGSARLLWRKFKSRGIKPNQKRRNILQRIVISIKTSRYTGKLTNHRRIVIQEIHKNFLETRHRTGWNRSNIWWCTFLALFIWTFSLMKSKGLECKSLL